MAMAFVIATVAVPTLHLIFHAAPHDHAGGETHYHFESHSDAREHQHEHEYEHEHEYDHERDHEDEEHAGGTGHRHDGPDHDEPRQPFDPRHGDGSFDHFSLAISDAPASAVAPVIVELLESGIVPHTRRASAVATAHFSVQRFRGPPFSG